jgi:hypothetical protein
MMADSQKRAGMDDFLRFIALGTFKNKDYR